MSLTAPQISLAVDWTDSEMFDGANDSVRLAWVCLLCYVKLFGSNGSVNYRADKFCGTYKLSVSVVNELLQRAIIGHAVEIDGALDFTSKVRCVLYVRNWCKYQPTRTRRKVTRRLSLGQSGAAYSTCAKGGRGVSSLELPEGDKPEEELPMVKPTLEEVRNYCQQRQNGIDPQEFIDFYESCGWVVGRARKPMKSWKGAVGTWETSRRKRQKQAELGVPLTAEECERYNDGWRPEL